MLKKCYSRNKIAIFLLSFTYFPHMSYFSSATQEK